MATGRGEEAEKAYKLAENRFLANDIAGALRAAREAQRLFRALPGLANAVTAYEVHAAAATSRANGRNLYAVLAVGDRSATTSSGNAPYESLKQQYRRLCLVLHPDKNRSVAAESAFKLLREAWDELSVCHRPAPVSRPPPPAAPAPRKKATAPAPKEKAWQGRGRSRTVNCPHCSWSFVTGIDDESFSVKCLHCEQWVNMPSQTRPPPPPPPPPPLRPTKSWKFPCPAHCAKCGAKYTATVSVGTWHLRCDACHTQATVYVKSAYLATTG